jgi:hypothetical protein
MIALSDKVETVAHVIQIALTPVFLFSGVATLLSVLSARLGRVADRVDIVSEKLDRAAPQERQRIEQRLANLGSRSVVLDAAVIMAALAGMSTLIAAGTLFIDGLRDRAGATLFVAFGAALLLTIGALAGFLYEMMLASGGIRRDTASGRTAEPPDAPEPAELPEPHMESPAAGD